MSCIELFLINSYVLTVRPGEKYKKNKQTKPDFLDMVPWYSGYISIIFYLFNFKYFFSSKRFYSGGGYVLQYISWSIQDWDRKSVV